MESPKCKGPFLDGVQAQVEARALDLELLFKGTRLGSLQLNGLFTNQVVHRVRILQYVHTRKQEYICIEHKKPVKEQCSKKRDKYIVKDP